ncbi:MAG: hypothetical protein WAL26_24680 [Mycobacterium sp.]
MVTVAVTARIPWFRAPRRPGAPAGETLDYVAHQDIAGVVGVSEHHSTGARRQRGLQLLNPQPGHPIPMLHTINGPHGSDTTS